MKTQLHLIAITVALGVGLLNAFAAERRIEAGPKGGRLLEKSEPRAEFVVEQDHTVSIHFYDGNSKPVPAAEQAVSVIADARSGKVRLQFEKKGDSLVSKGRLPEGDGYNVVVQLQAAAGARPRNFRFTLELHQCGGCKRAEYACTCGH
jgi:hypothetical protein